MFARGFFGQGRRLGVFPVAIMFIALSLTLLLPPDTALGARKKFVMRIYDYKTGEIYACTPARPGGKLFFGWIHSLEKIPWNEYYHIDKNGELILDTITFPAFGAGIPENKGRVCYVKDGLIYMEEIGQRFGELVWLNSHTATRDITLNGKLVARGGQLPQHTRLRLVIERKRQ
ncbi:MAG: DUF1850 domain-containing protein [Acidaminococcales bacterium]|jgi:hypothetical protein|nr:DUF1850 domain-containing protein [Acidaminococcales bacterium]